MALAAIGAQNEDPFYSKCGSCCHRRFLVRSATTEARAQASTGADAQRTDRQIIQDATRQHEAEESQAKRLNLFMDILVNAATHDPHDNPGYAAGNIVKGIVGPSPLEAEAETKYDARRIGEKAREAETFKE